MRNIRIRNIHKKRILYAFLLLGFGARYGVQVNMRMMKDYKDL